MLQVTLSVRMRCPWLASLARRGGEARLLQCIPRASSNGVSALAKISGSGYSPDDIASEIRRIPAIEGAYFTSVGRGTLIGIVTTNSCPCAYTLLPHHNTLRVNQSDDGVLTWTLLVESGVALKRVLENLRSKGLEYKVERVERLRRAWSLTPRQEQILRAALELGFYEVPRKIDLHGLAKLFKTSPRAASETLRRAERKILSSALGDVGMHVQGTRPGKGRG